MLIDKGFRDFSILFYLISTIAQSVGGELWRTPFSRVLWSILTKKLVRQSLKSITQAPLAIHQVQVGLFFSSDRAFVRVYRCGKWQLVSPCKGLYEVFCQVLTLLHSQTIRQGNGNC